jgi:hypothetical protein
MSLLGLTFGAPIVLLGLLALPVIWYLLRLTPPRPRLEIFPPTRILVEITPKEETPAQSPWWLTLLRLAMAAIIILALSEPVWNAPDKRLSGDGPMLVVMDDGWTSGANWNVRRDAALGVVEEAQEADRPVALALSSEGALANINPGNALAALEKLSSIEPKPLPSDYDALGEKLAGNDIFSTLVWFTPDVAPDGLETFTKAAEGLEQVIVFRDETRNPTAITDVANAPDALTVSLTRPLNAAASEGTVQLLDIQGRALGVAPYIFAAGDGVGKAQVELPVELRNDVARVVIPAEQTAGAVHLLDERFRRRIVGLIGGGNADRDQPLLSPLYYIERALAPFAQIRNARSERLPEAAEQLISENVSTLVLADIGTMQPDMRERIAAWVDGGGMLVRFAGPRLAGAEELSTTGGDLVPVMLRGGGRALGGTLSWDTPQPLARFEDTSPFAGLPVPQDVTVSRQVLAEPDAELPSKTWASLEDGTPLVTAAPSGEGWIVLFHVTANASWSNLPLSGSFVDMLRRIVAVSNGVAGSGETQTEASILPPLRVLDGEGRLTAPGAQVRPAAISSSSMPNLTIENPPGLYGTSEAFIALNLFKAGDRLAPLDASALPSGAQTFSLVAEDPLTFKPWLLVAALLLLTLDCFAVLWMAGALRRPQRFASAGMTALIFALLLPLPDAQAHAQAQAQDSEITDYDYALRTHLAYVETGVEELDTLSRKGLEGLTQFISTRTSLEPGPPVAVDIGRDELAFFPLLYWPIDPTSPVPDDEAMARIDAFMKSGGSVLFDTRDQVEGGFGKGVVTPATLKLREILSALDIPPLEPVPDQHVLTRAFYLLNVFAGRYFDGQLWVETSEVEDDLEDRPARAGDGVSSILITANDMAGAWAVEPDGSPSLPVISTNPRQRVFAYRAGVNIVMYTLTGNYKSDQVHVPSLLERLGQ